MWPVLAQLWSLFKVYTGRLKGITKWTVHILIWMHACEGIQLIRVYTRHYVVFKVYLFMQVCKEGHVTERWASQPLLNRGVHSGDFLICATILTSGNNYGKLSLWSSMLQLKFPSASQFHRIQATYLVPSIDKYWAHHQAEVLESFKDEQLVVMGMSLNSHLSLYISLYNLKISNKMKCLALCRPSWMHSKKDQL